MHSQRLLLLLLLPVPSRSTHAQPNIPLHHRSVLGNPRHRVRQVQEMLVVKDHVLDLHRFNVGQRRQVRGRAPLVKQRAQTRAGNVARRSEIVHVDRAVWVRELDIEGIGYSYMYTVLDDQYTQKIAFRSIV
ncbi:hypothetical protein BC828DRAFT_300781 [Blastocladiella britannica]|nr:hypothetical protein BC828DRAFT_300781 [Blastocladiella britannica]